MDNYRRDSDLAKKEKKIHILKQLTYQQNLVKSYHQKWSEVIQVDKMPIDAIYKVLKTLYYDENVIQNVLQNNGVSFCGGLWKDGAGGGCGSGE